MSVTYEDEDELEDIIAEHRSWKDRVVGAFSKAARRSSIIEYNSGWSNVQFYQKEALLEIVKDQPDVRACGAVIVDAVVGDWKFKTKKKDATGTEEIDPRVKEMTDWAERADCAFDDKLKKIQYALLYRSNVFIEIVHGDNSTVPAFYVLNPAYCTRVPNEQKTRTIGFNYQPPGVKTPTFFKAEDSVIAAVDCLDSSEEGYPVLLTLLEDANLNRAARNYAKNLYKSGGLGRKAFVLEEENNKDTYEAVKADIENRRNRKTGSIAIRGKIKIHDLSWSLQEMVYKDVDEGFKQKVMSLFRVPPIMMSLKESSFKDASKSEMNAFSSRIRADKKVLATIIDEVMLKLWGKRYTGLWFDLGIWVDPLTRAQMHKIYTEIGVTTPNEIRDEMNLNPVAWGKIPFNFNLWPQVAPMYDPELAAFLEEQESKRAETEAAKVQADGAAREKGKADA